jgi:filamentous hemagglutinin family protein
MMKTPTLQWVAITLSVFLLSKNALGDVITDGSLGAAASLTGPDFAMNAALGQQRGNNLFHSLSQLDIANGESLTFSGPATIENIIIRVTGGTGVTLDGVIRSTIAGANVYLFTKGGYTELSNFSSDFSGTYSNSGTATALAFADLTQFFVVPQGGEVLSTAAPTGFLEPTLTTGSIPSNIKLGDSINTSYSTSNFLNAVTPSLTGNVPSGLSVAGGAISGTPTTEGTYVFALEVTDGTDTLTANFNLVVGPFPSIDLTSFPSQILLGQTINATFTTNDFSGTVTSSLTGNVPPGLTVSNEKLAGLPTSIGSFTFSLVVTDGTYTATETLTLQVIDEVLSETINIQQYANTVSFISYTLDPNDILEATKSHIVTGSLPSGFRIEGNQLIGVFNSTGTFNFSITSSSGNDQVVHSFSYIVIPPTSTPLITDVSINGVSSQTLILSAPTNATSADIQPFAASIPLGQRVEIGFGFDFIKPSFSWTIISGDLPEGLLLDGASGVLFGTPTQAGTFSFIVSVMDWRGRGYLRVNLTVK